MNGAGKYIETLTAAKTKTVNDNPFKFLLPLKPNAKKKKKPTTQNPALAPCPLANRYILTNPLIMQSKYAIL